MAGGDAGALSQAEGQLQRLSGLQQRLEHAGPGALAAIRAEVVASVAASQASSQLARTSAAMAQAAEVALHTASAAAHREVSALAHDFYDKKIFDPYLRFSSEEDEQAYRKREAEREQYIRDQLAKGTPDGNLNAARVMKEQMGDAGAHGADASPDFQNRLDALNAADNNLSAAIAAEKVGAPAKQASEVVDPLDDIAPQLDETSKKALAQFRAVGIVVSETSHAAHGVTTSARVDGAPSRLA